MSNYNSGGGGGGGANVCYAYKRGECDRRSSCRFSHEGGGEGGGDGGNNRQRSRSGSDAGPKNGGGGGVHAPPVAQPKPAQVPIFNPFIPANDPQQRNNNIKGDKAQPPLFGVPANEVNMQEDATFLNNNSPTPRSTAASQWLFKTSEQEKSRLTDFIGNKLKVISEGDRRKVYALFDTLDINKSGELDEGDFTHSIPAVSEQLKKIWNTIRIKFDFDGDGKVVREEFIGYFIIYALFNAKAPKLEGKYLHLQLETWNTAFSTAFNEELNKFHAVLQKK